MTLTCDLQVKPKCLSLADHIPPTQTVSPNLDPLGENRQSAHAGPVVDVVTSGELFLNWEKLFLTSAENHNLKHQIQYRYNSTPSIDFCPIAKPSPANATRIKLESESTSLKVIRSNLENNSVTASDPHPEDPYKGLQAVLEHIIPSDLYNRYKDNPDLCVASHVKKPSVRCGHKIRRQPITVLEIVSRCIQKGDLATLPEGLKKLAKVVLCGRHQNVALKQPKAKARIEALREYITNLPSGSEEDASSFRAWTMALANLSPPVPTRWSAREPLLTEALLGTNTTIASNSKIMPRLPGFLPYKPTRVSDIDITENLKKLIAKPLTPADMKSGFIYIFWNQGSFGMVKIGRTNNLERRLEQWKKCKSTHFYHRASRDGQLVEVPYVQRIERLIHTELVNTRRKQACDACEKVHQEWFQTSEAKVVEVFQKWRAWILNEPYVKDGGRGWVVRPEMLETIPGLCTLEQEKTSSAKTKPRPVGNRSKGLRPKPPRSSAIQALGALESTQTSRNVPRGRTQMFA